MGRMATRRRWFQFSLRGFLVVLTAFSLWLGSKVNTAHEQHEAVKLIEGLGGVVRYDWESPFVFPPKRPTFVCGNYLNAKFNAFDFDWNKKRSRGPGGPTKTQQFIGEDLFQSAKEAWFDGRFFEHYKLPLEEELIKAIPTLRRIKSLKNLYIDAYLSTRTMAKLRAGLPGVVVLRPEVPNSYFGPRNRQ